MTARNTCEVCGVERAQRALPSGALDAFRNQFGMPLDREISYAVLVLRDAGIETYESCEGGDGHPFTEPTIRFHGGSVAGYRAVTVALEAGLPVSELRRFWSVLSGELCGPNWEMTFHPKGRLIEIQREAEAREADDKPHALGA